MNYLAHAYLSFRNTDVLAGNMISDFVKGKKQYDYPAGIQKGIRLHRLIDTFTDQHPATQHAKTFLKPAVGLYAGAFVDVVYDHFLATDSDHFNEASLRQFSQEVYGQLYRQAEWLPERFASMLPYMSAQDWLFNYSQVEGTRLSFGGVVRRAKHLTDSSAVFALFLDHYDALQEAYNSFFPELHAYASIQFSALLMQ